MNNPVSWTKRVISDNQIEFVSESTFGGAKVAKATFTEGTIQWSTDDIPFLVIEQAQKHFGII